MLRKFWNYITGTTTYEDIVGGITRMVDKLHDHADLNETLANAHAETARVANAATAVAFQVASKARLTAGKLEALVK